MNTTDHDHGPRAIECERLAREIVSTVARLRAAAIRHSPAIQDRLARLADEIEALPDTLMRNELPGPY